MNKKCIVLDLDNTLWGGVIGEDGIHGIELGTKGRGAGFVAFQQALLDLYNKGILLAINSRNNENDALQVIREHPNMILKENHFAARRINWQDKASNLKEIITELNIGADTIVFLDDDLSNQALVRELLPEVCVPDLPTESENFASFLISSPYFNLTTITDEDKMRGNLYVTERLRKEMEKSFTNKQDFLSNLKIELHVHQNDIENIARLSQLTEKTNQFNLNKIPLSEGELTQLMRDPNYLIVHGRIIDRFGDHGITNLAIIKKENDTWNVVQYLMSCRVIGKEIEHAFVHALAALAHKEGVRALTFSFQKTEKNIPGQDFLEQIGGSSPIDVSRFKSPQTINILYK